MLCENDYLRIISESVIGSKVNEIQKKHCRSKTKFNNLIKTVNNSLIDDKHEEISIKEDDILRLTMGEMNSTMKKNTGKIKSEADLFSNKIKTKKINTNICYIKKNK
jgi:hypothetical protein